MNEDEKFVDFQEETIYVCKQFENEEEIERKLAAFFSELVKRRRDDPMEDGLQADIVILPDKSAMKICEMNGTAPHMQASTNLIKHLNDDHKYISVTGMSYFALHRNERRQLIESGIDIRVLDGEKELMLAIMSSAKTISQYQIEMINKLLLFCKNLKDTQTYDKVNIGIHISGCEIEFGDLTDDHYKNILNGLQRCTESKNININL